MLLIMEVNLTLYFHDLCVLNVTYLCYRKDC